MECHGIIILLNAKPSCSEWEQMNLIKYKCFLRLLTMHLGDVDENASPSVCHREAAVQHETKLLLCHNLGVLANEEDAW
jgi:hypothetical protein